MNTQTTFLHAFRYPKAVVLAILLASSTFFSLKAQTETGTGTTPIPSYKFVVNSPITPINLSDPTHPMSVTGAHTISLAGSTQGFADGTSASARFNNPTGVVMDAAGNTYIADCGNHCIRKILANGTVTTLAGSGSPGFADRTGEEAAFYRPTGIALDKQGNIYVADKYNHRIRKITPAGVVTTLAGTGQAGFADGDGSVAQFNFPSGVAVDPEDGNIYVADTQNHRIRKITPEGIVSNYAGNGNAGLVDGRGYFGDNVAEFNMPTGIFAGPSSTLYIADYGNHCIREICSNSYTSILAGTGVPGHKDGKLLESQFYFPTGVAQGVDDNIYVADAFNHCIRKLDQKGKVSTLSGTGGAGSLEGGSAASYNMPYGLTTDAYENVIVTDCGNNKIRKVVDCGYSPNYLLAKGLVLDSLTGILSGTPNKVGSGEIYYTINIRRTDWCGRKKVNLQVIPTDTVPSYTVITVVGKYLSDVMMIFVLPGCSIGFDNGYDGLKMFGSPECPQIFAKGLDDYSFDQEDWVECQNQVQTVGTFDNTDIGFWAGRDTTYTLSFSHTDLNRHCSELFLIDLIANQVVDVYPNGSTYVFDDTHREAYRYRFKLVTSYPNIPGVILKNKEISNQLKVIALDNKSLLVNNGTDSGGNLAVYNLSGIPVQQARFNASTLTTIALPHLTTGTYVVKLQTNNLTTTQKILIP